MAGGEQPFTKRLQSSACTESGTDDGGTDGLQCQDLPPFFLSSSFSVRSMVIVILVEASRFLNCNRGFGQVVEMMISDGAGGFSHPIVNVVGRK